MSPHEHTSQTACIFEACATNPYRRNDHRLENAHNGTSRIARSTTKDDQVDDQNAPFTSV